MSPPLPLRAAALAVLAACAAAPAAAQALCAAPRRVADLPPEARESSGLAFSARRDGVLWTHNDSGGRPELFAVSEAGRALGVTRVRGADAQDWEDVAVARCGAGSCVYLADVGDNAYDRRTIDVYRIPEPLPGEARSAARAERFRMRYPDGAHDAEAIFVLPGERLHVVTKGAGDGGIVVYRYPGALDAGRTVTLERAQVLSARPVARPARVTGASATPDGRWVALRTYAALRLYRVDPSGRGPLLVPVGLPRPLADAQGEGVALRADGTVMVSSEAPQGRGRASLSRVACRLPAR